MPNHSNVSIWQTLVDSGEVDPSEVMEIKDDLKDAADGVKELQSDCGKKVRVHKKHCSICKKEGHNKRTCPQR